MEYTVRKLAELAGLTPRALRFYDEKGLLKPQRINSSGYRIYSETQVDLLQQILFYRELGLELEEIKAIIYAEDFDLVSSLESHLEKLVNQRKHMDRLIENVSRSIAHHKGELNMSDKEKFEGFKQKLVRENTSRYGRETTEKYGEKAVEASNRKFLNMTEEEYGKMNELNEKLMVLLKSILETGDETGEKSKQAALTHKAWLQFTWGEYSKEAHIGLADMYIADERFKAYYESGAGAGAAEVLRDAVKKYI